MPPDGTQVQEPTGGVTTSRVVRRARRWPWLAGVLTLALVFGSVALIHATTSNSAVVPMIEGKPLAVAEDALSSNGLHWSVVHLNRAMPRTRHAVVLVQNPAAGSSAAKGSTIQLTVYGLMPSVNGPTVRTPNLVGMVQWIASNAIFDRGLTPIVVGPTHEGSRFRYWTIVSQSPRPGTALRVGQGSVVIRTQEPPPIAVASRLPVSACASSKASGTRVEAAYLISSAQLKRAPISDAGPLSRQAPGSLWRLCYVTGPHVIQGLGPPGSPAWGPPEAIYVFYRNGMIAEEAGMYSIRFVVTGRG